MNVVHARKKNHTKASSYRAAWERIERAIELGCWFEAIALLESVLSDRLGSHLVGTGTLKRASNVTLNELIAALDRDAPDAEIRSIVPALHEWRRARNQALHAFVRSEPGTATASPETALAAAEAAAKSGRTLARKIDRWCTRALRNARRAD